MNTATRFDDKELLERAYSAYFRGNGGADQPSSYDSGPAEVNGKVYVVLRNVNGPLKVYRVTKCGGLRSLTDHQLEKWCVREEPWKA